MPLRDALLALYFVVCALAVTWPGFALLGSGLEPRVLGLPWSFAWSIGWIVATFVALLAYHLTASDPEQ